MLDFVFMIINNLELAEEIIQSRGFAVPHLGLSAVI